MFAAIDFPAIDPAAVTLPAVTLFGMTLGPFALRWYALAYIAGLMLGWRYMVRMVRAERLWSGGQARPNAPQADDFLFYATLGVILGGRLGYVLFYQPSLLWERPMAILAIWEGGMSFHGGLIGVGLAILYFARAQKIPLLTLGDLTAAAAPIGLFFGRIANFINAELYGRATDAPWGVIFPNSDGQPRHPSQLYEAFLEGLVLFAILAVAVWRFKALKRPGLAIGIFLAGYGLFRSMVELVREPDAHMPNFPAFFTMGMMLSLPMVAIGAAIIAGALRKPPRPA
jgi:phosphatidylglycerol:prolipoprotein diacylglycerol transferase